MSVIATKSVRCWSKFVALRPVQQRRPKEHQHSAAARRDAGPTAPGEGRRIKNDWCHACVK